MLKISLHVEEMKKKKTKQNQTTNPSDQMLANNLIVAKNRTKTALCCY